MRDESTYGFNKADAESLLRHVGGNESEYSEGRVRGNGGGGGRLVVTPGGGIPARSGTTVSSASCTEYKIVGTTLTTNTNSLTVFNIWPVAIPASYYVTAKQIGGKWIADFPGVIDVDWTSPDLRQTLDGTNYSTIDTATACP